MAEAIGMPFGLRTGVGPRNNVLDGVHIPNGTGNFEGEGPSHCKVYGHSAVICAKTAEPIQMPFGLWTRMGPSKHVLDGAKMPHAKGQLLGERTCLGMPNDTAVSCAKMAELIDLPFGLWTRVGRRKHKFNHICKTAPMCPHGRANRLQPENTIELSVCGGDAALCQITLTTCYTVITVSK